jgi:hypothetical protein
MLSRLRQGFVRSGGATNLESVNESGYSDASDTTIDVATGLAAVFVPITLLKAVGVVQFSGGRGLLAIADLDVLVADAILIASLGLCLSYRQRAKAQMPYTVYCIILGATAAVLMGYVVTNFGTLFRLRLIAFLPLWLTSLALVPAAGVVDAAAAPKDSPSRAAAA